jgi:hypothetical protein
MNLPMSWDEWADHDGVALAARVAKGELTAAELARRRPPASPRSIPRFQPSSKSSRMRSPTPPRTAPISMDRLPDSLPDEGPWSDDAGPAAGNGLALHARQPRHGRHVHDDEDARAGLNLIGRTTTPEFGVCSSADNPAVYVTRNPWNTDYTTCGSSAGSAAMVAAGAVPIAHATDGGGSIRIPAGVNGNIGLKVSRGVFSLSPHLSDLSGLVSIQGCQSRTVRDTAAFVDACRGPAPGEFMPFWSPPEPYTRMIARDPGR